MTEQVRYWFRKVPGTGSRYVAIDWRGYAAIVAAVVMPLAATFLALSLAGWLALAIGPVALLAALWWLFAVVAKRVEP